MTQEEALEILWKNKDWKDKKEDKFVYATTTKDIEIMDFSTPNKPKIERTISAGATVLVTMYSRFGDVGIRDDRLEPPSNGYYARVLPHDLRDWRDKP
jgi:hypothetical protein